MKFNYKLLILPTLALATLFLLTGFSKEKDAQVHNPVKEVQTKHVKVSTILLDVDNTLNIRTPFFDEYFDGVFKSASQHALITDKSLYTVLYTPGGSVSTGNSIISTLNGLKRPVHTITIFAASMGFQTAQNLGERYILPTGTLMSHQMSGGVEGSFGSNLETRYAHSTRMGDLMDERAAKRMKLSLKDYKLLIANEWWKDGQDAIDKNAADKVVNIVCTKRLIESKERIAIDTIFGPVYVVFSGCPLLTIPSIEFSKPQLEKNTTPQQIVQMENIRKNIELMLTNHEYMYKNYIRTGRKIDVNSNSF